MLGRAVPYEVGRSGSEVCSGGMAYMCVHFERGLDVVPDEVACDVVLTLVDSATSA